MTFSSNHCLSSQNMAKNQTSNQNLNPPKTIAYLRVFIKDQDTGKNKLAVVKLAQGSLLFGFGIDNTSEDVDYVLEVLPPIVDKLRQMSPLYAKFMKQGKGGK